jgi:hypothetical protein
MSKNLRHSEQSTACHFGRHNFLPLGGVPIAIGRGLLLLLLMFGNRYAYAQNTGSGPYLNSWHTYRVVAGNATNPREWDITDGTDTIHLANSMAWCDIPALASGNADISICFTDSVFLPLGPTWHLLYRELSAATGSCIAARQFTINLTENTFYLTMDADSQDCKPEDGKVFRWDELENINFQCSFPFTVTMHKEASLTINHWKFDGAFTFDNGTHTIADITASMGTANGGTINTFTNLGGGQFRVEVSQPVTSTLTEVSIYITLTLSGYVYNGVTATLTLENGIINSGVAGVTNTNDNLLRPTEGPPDNVADPALRDRVQNMTFLPLPATSNITIAD